jgi:hypothetical protein
MLIEKSTAFYLLSYYYEIKYNRSLIVYSTSNPFKAIFAGKFL